MRVEQGVRVGGYVVMRTSDGLRLAIRLGAVSCLADADTTGEETVIQLGGRQYVIDAPFERVLGWLERMR